MTRLLSLPALRGFAMNKIGFLAIALCSLHLTVEGRSPHVARDLPSTCTGGVQDENNGTYALELTASKTTIYNNFEAAFNGSSDDNLFAINISSNAGTVTQKGRTTNVIVNVQIPWDETTLYGIIGVDPEGILMGWIYCSTSSLTTLWLEDTTGAAGFTSSTVTGTCTVTSNTKNVDFSVPEETINVTPPSSFPTIDGGAELSLQSDLPGNVTLLGKPYTLLPFTIVDCSNCTDDSNSHGWVEVHSVMSSKTSINVCLGIFYLPLVHKPSIALDYVNCFTEDVSDQAFNASYDIPPANQTSHKLVARQSNTAAACSATPTSGSSRAKDSRVSWSFWALSWLLVNFMLSMS